MNEWRQLNSNFENILLLPEMIAAFIIAHMKRQRMFLL